MSQSSDMRIDFVPVISFPIVLRTTVQGKLRIYWAVLTDGGRYECSFINQGNYKKMEKISREVLQKKQDTLV